MNPLRAALYAHLTSDPTLVGMLATATSVYHQQAPQGAAFPFVVFNRQAGTPAWQFAGDPVQDDLWQIKAVSRASSASQAENIAERLDAILNRATLTITGRLHLSLLRESDVDYPEQDDADSYQHVGALYRIFTQPA